MYRSSHTDVDYLTDCNVVLLKRKKFCRHEEYRAPLLHALEIIRGHEGCQYVADTRDGFENDPDDTRWLIEEFLPATAATTCTRIFFIIARDNRLKEELEGQAVELRKLFEVHYCFDIDEVREIQARG